MPRSYIKPEIFLLQRDTEGKSKRPNCCGTTSSFGVLIPALAFPYLKVKAGKSSNFIRDTVCRLWEIYLAAGNDRESAIETITVKTGLEDVFVRYIIENQQLRRDLKTGEIEKENIETRRVWLFYDIFSESWMDGYLGDVLFSIYSDFDRIEEGENGIWLFTDEVKNYSYGPFYRMYCENVPDAERIPEPSKTDLSRMLRRDERISGREQPVPVWLAGRIYVPDGHPSSIHIEYPYPNGDIILSDAFVSKISKTGNKTIENALFLLKEEAKRYILMSAATGTDPYRKRILERFTGIENWAMLFNHLSELEMHRENYRNLKKNGSLDDIKNERSELAFCCHSVFESALIAAYNKRNSRNISAKLSGFVGETEEIKRNTINDLLFAAGFYLLDDESDEKKDVIDFLLDVKDISPRYMTDYVPQVNEIFLCVLGAACENPGLIPLKKAASDKLCSQLPSVLKKSLFERNEGKAHKSENIREQFIPEEDDILERCEMAFRLTEYLVTQTKKAPSEEKQSEILSAFSENEVMNVMEKYAALMRRPSNDIRNAAAPVISDLLLKSGLYYRDGLTLLATIMSALLAPKIREDKYSNVVLLFRNGSVSVQDMKTNNKKLVWDTLNKYGFSEDWKDIPNMSKLPDKVSELNRQSAHALFYVAAVYLDQYEKDYLKKLLAEIPELHSLIDYFSSQRGHHGMADFKSDEAVINQKHMKLMECADKACTFLEEFSNRKNNTY